MFVQADRPTTVSGTRTGIISWCSNRLSIEHRSIAKTGCCVSSVMCVCVCRERHARKQRNRIASLNANTSKLRLIIKGKDEGNCLRRFGNEDESFV